MEFVNEFHVPAPSDQVWTLLSDVPQVAECLPGATARETEADRYEGEIEVRVGPIRVKYTGTAEVIESDSSRGRMVVSASGRDAGGRGTADARIDIDITETEPGHSHVKVVTTLDITGRVAQFGRNAMADVGESIVKQFAENIARHLSGDTATEFQESEPDASRSNLNEVKARSDSLEMGMILVPLVKRAIPVSVGLALGIIIGISVRRPDRRNRRPYVGNSNPSTVVVCRSVL